MVKRGKYLNTLYSKMVHVTRAARGLRRMSEEVRGRFSTADKTVSNVKNVLEKPRHVYSYLKLLPRTFLHRQSQLSPAGIHGQMPQFITAKITNKFMIL